MTDKCSTCYFVRAQGSGYECHINPPNTLNLQGPLWRQVDANDWCGEYTASGPIASGVRPAALAWFMCAAAPAGYLLCDGTAYTRVAYPQLYAAIDAAFHVDADNFTVPDMRGYFARGLDLGAGVDPARALGTTQTDAFKAHTHNFDKTGSAMAQILGATDVGANPPSPTATTSTGDTETRPKNMAWLACIKY